MRYNWLSAPPNDEIGRLDPQRVNGWDLMLIVYGLLGVAVGAFQWNASPWFIDAKQRAAEWLIEHDILWPLSDNAPWWLLTHYPANNDLFSWLDGAMITGYILATAALLGSWVLLWLAFSARDVRQSLARQHHPSELQPGSTGGMRRISRLVGAHRIAIENRRYQLSLAVRSTCHVARRRGVLEPLAGGPAISGYWQSTANCRIAALVARSRRSDLVVAAAVLYLVVNHCCEYHPIRLCPADLFIAENITVCAK